VKVKDTLQTLSNQPEIGIGTSLGSGLIYWMDILNPILSFCTLAVGLLIGLVTLAIKIREWKK
tara:strand:+ start:3467 stop:3655 length:189 start_codon:yes stop_codon:yes gene_type:complete